MKFSFFRKKPFFTDLQQQRIVESVRAAEHQTSGEIRVYVESRCRFVDPLDRAAEVFELLKMRETAERNGVLVYVALKDRQLALLGDQGIHEKVGSAFWNEQVRTMLAHFNREHYTDGIVDIIAGIGEALRQHFPYNKETDINELPDDIVFGR